MRGWGAQDFDVFAEQLSQALAQPVVQQADPAALPCGRRFVVNVSVADEDIVVETHLPPAEVMQASSAVALIRGDARPVGSKLNQPVIEFPIGAWPNR
jgi:hypothetical protein